MSNEINILPEGWQKTTLEHLIIRISNGANVTQHEEKIGLPITRIETIWNGKIDLNRVKYIKEDNDELRLKYGLMNGDILFSHINSDSHLGKTAIFQSQVKCLIHGTNLLLIRPSAEISSKYLNYQFQLLRQKGEFVAVAQRAVNQSSINQRKLKAFEFVLPPFNEQRRIVAKIEELFSELDKGVESLKTARAQLKVYRQALLKHAFEGKLTAQWREENKDKLEKPEQLLARIKQEREVRYEQQLKEWKAAVKKWEEGGKSGKKPAKPKKPPETFDVPDALSDKLPQLPESWGWIRVGDFCEVVRGGSPRPAGDPHYYDGTIPFLKVADLTRTAGVYLDTHSFSIKEAGLRKTRLVKPPILMLSNSGATLGVPKVCRIRTTFNDGIAAFLGLDENDLLYHYYFWASKTLELRAINQGAAQPNLNTSLIEETFIPLCSKKEMQIVARDIGRSLSMCGELTADINIQLMKSIALRQSILKKAFSGQLVAQDPRDEPASVLLDRIRAEREKAAKNNHSKKTKKRKAAA